METVRIFGQVFEKERFDQALDALEKVDPELAFLMEGAAIYEEDV